ncbi:MAG: DegT/DnrJ/EryC1/StrS family aminotransferase [Candidatus Omnitrophica bacterium]|nr:DegT/DnrJ/EryC1/StrS family aminotransferase [Candidatus Omnitrophota bacterium]
MPDKKEAAYIAKSKFKVPFGTVSLTAEARRLIDEAWASNWVTQGKYVAQFERAFARRFDSRHAVAVSSGTDAVAVACAVLYDFGAQRGDEIIVPALTFIASGNAVLQAGFKPVFVDVDRTTLNIDPRQIEKVITARTRAILPVHLMGKPAPMDAVCCLAQKHGLFVIEDAAEAHGARYHDQAVGTIGDVGAFSLYAAHILTSIEGGMVLTQQARMAEALVSLRNHGMTGKFEAGRIGFSAKMHELEAAVGLGNMAIFSRILEKRRQNLLYLIDCFQAFAPFFITMEEGPDERIGPHAFPIILKEGLPFGKDEFVGQLESSGIDTRNLFYSIPTQCPGYQFLGYQLGDFPEAEYCSAHGTHIGIHQGLEREQLDYVVDTIQKFLKDRGCL